MYTGFMDKDFYSIKEFAKKLGISEITVRRHIKKGRLLGFRFDDGGTYRIPHAEIYRIAENDIKKTLEKLK